MSFFDRVTGNKTREEDLPEEKARFVDGKFGFVSFFKLAFHRVGNLCKLNLLILLMISPIIFTLFGFSGSFFAWQISDTAFSPTSAVFPNYQGIAAYESGSAFEGLQTTFSFLTTVNIDNTATTVLKWLGIIVVFLFGPMNVGCTYVLRNTVKEEHVFLWQDFFYAIKKNFKQAMIFGVLDCVFIAAIVYALPFYYSNANTFAIKMLFAAMIMIALLYFVMRIYIYLMIVTFDLSFRKLFKYAFILTTAGIKRTLVMLLGLALLFLASVYLVILLRGFGMVLFFIFLLAFAYLICIYCSYPVMKKYMIDPFYDEDGSMKEDEPDGEGKEQPSVS